MEKANRKEIIQVMPYKKKLQKRVKHELGKSKTIF